jgi:transcriptional regulator with XRE-family HTH domain
VPNQKLLLYPLWYSWCAKLAHPIGARMTPANLAGPRIRERRRSLGITQDELAARLQVRGVSLERAGISKIETQNRAITDIELRAFALALGAQPSWLLDVGGNRDEDGDEVV